ncbi:MAG: hypothetical protein MUO81_03285 [Thermoplasmata archaeon]|nr:hypothetical protein [Thermoplasmata archaeon]
MGKFSRKTILLLLLTLVLITVILRYPLIQHERFQTDSYFIHYLAKSIGDEGFMRWTFHPLSYFGYYPVSYPSGMPVVLAELSELTGLSVELSVLVADVMFAGLFALVVFCLSREFLGRSEYALLAAFFASVGPRFVDTTYWNGSARGLVVVLMILLVLLALRASSTRQNRLYVLAGLICFGCVSVHHMAVLIVLYGSGFVLAVIGLRYVRVMKGTRIRRLAIASFVGVCTLVALSVLTYFGMLADTISRAFGGQGFFSIESALLSTLLNMGLSYTHQIGFVLLLSIAGLFIVLRRPVSNVRALFPISVILVSVPAFGSSLYVSMLLAPFVAILGLMYVREALRNGRRKKLVLSIVGMLVVVSLVFPIWSSQRWNDFELSPGGTVVVRNQIFNDATYLRVNAYQRCAISNADAVMGQLQSFTDLYFPRSLFAQTANGDITASELQGNITPSRIGFPWKTYVWFDYQKEYETENIISGIMRHGWAFVNGSGATVIKASEPFSSHPKMFIVVDNNFPTQYATSYSMSSAIFLTELRNAQSSDGKNESLPSYMVYQSERITTYVLEMPTR